MPSIKIKHVLQLQICQNKLFKSIEQWIRDQRKYGNLYTITGSPEYQEVVMLIDQTWQRHLVGHGKDARNLGHSKLQVSRHNNLRERLITELHSLLQSDMLLTWPPCVLVKLTVISVQCLDECRLPYMIAAGICHVQGACAVICL